MAGNEMKQHITSALIASAVTFSLLTLMAFLRDYENQYCEVKFEESSATLPCAELNARVYTVRF
jgi:hypothetical protein